MDFLSLGQLFMILGFASLILEIFLLGMGTIVFLFLGVSFVLVGGIIHYQYAVVYDTFGNITWILSLIVVMVMTVILSYIFWRPLKRFQSAHTFDKETSSDFVGHVFVLPDSLTKEHKVTYRFFGVDWHILPEDSHMQKLNKGQQVKVVRVSPGKIWVCAYKE